jgi:hypothetical protein
VRFAFDLARTRIRRKVSRVTKAVIDALDT